MRRIVHVLSVIVCFSIVTRLVHAAAVDSLDARPPALALDEMRRAWLGQLNELISTARELAVADDTYEFVKRPNIPYVYAHYDPDHLTAQRIDTVLIINLRGEPIFWRRVNQGQNHGFPDARQFLAELPKLETVGVAGVPSLAGAAELIHGPKLLVAMPIYSSGGSGVARGWLIAARPLDPQQWRRYEELTHESEEALASSAPPGSKPPRSFLGVADLQRSASFDSAVLQPPTAVAASVSPATKHRVPLRTLLVVACVPLLIFTGIRHRPRGMMAWLRRPRGTGAKKPTGGSNANDARTPCIGEKSGSGDPQVALAERFSAHRAVFHYQPQIDLRTGRVAGVEALLCVPATRGFRPALELAAEIEAAGHGMALVERRLQEACRQQCEWVKKVGHDFPIGVPVSQRSLANPAFLPLVLKTLAQYELAPSLLELQIEEPASGANAVSLRVRALQKIREAGISVAVDGFNAAHINLRLLSMLPISKLRVAPNVPAATGVSPATGEGRSTALLFAGIIGAARGLGIAVCATGVNSPDMLSVVLEHGRPLAQGSALSAVQTGGEFLELLLRNNVDTATLPVLDFDEGLQFASA